MFGSPDSENVGAYNEKSEPNTFVITKIGTSFPSDIEIKEGEMHTVGGLILLKLKNTGKLS